MRKIFFTIFAFLILLPVGNVRAANFSDYINFNVDETYDAGARSQITATLVKTTPNLYFYIEKSWWDLQVEAKQNEILANLNNLSFEFDGRIYPILTSVFGSEWKPGVDGDSRVTLLFHSMKEGVGGYFNSADEYIKLQAPSSNEREMLYFPISQIDNSYKLKVFLAHEFTHLITFNQKERINGTGEETWLDESRAEYAVTILGYNNPYNSSNLQSRVKDLLEKPTDPLTEWQGLKYDYGVTNMFIHYLADQYGVNILADSLKLKSIGIASINEALFKNGYKENFSQIFTNWIIALVINNCSDGSKYCYLETNLNNFRINPALIFLPVSGDSSLSLTNVTKDWSGNWQKIIGVNGNLKLEFSSLAGLNFKVPYILFGKDGTYSVKFLTLDENQKGVIDIQNFGADYNSLVIIPSLQTKLAGFNGDEPTYPYTINVAVTGNVPKEEMALQQDLLNQIESLKNQIAAILAKNKSGSTLPSPGVLCVQLNNNLYFGLLNSSEVRCLQQFLKSQGISIYPEGLISGNFGSLTKSAVIRFQEKYKSEVLTPIGLSQGTGFVGTLTRQKINALLK